VLIDVPSRLSLQSRKSAANKHARFHSYAAAAAADTFAHEAPPVQCRDRGECSDSVLSSGHSTGANSAYGTAVLLDKAPLKDVASLKGKSVGTNRGSIGHFCHAARFGIGRFDRQ
jgi:ABC-type amino acid transport substrate-binding protein